MSNEHCVMCGEIVPEGQMVCPRCKKNIEGIKTRNGKEVAKYCLDKRRMLVFILGLALLIIFAIKPVRAEDVDEKTKTCPYCCSEIHVDAKICPYCQQKIINTDVKGSIITYMLLLVILGVCAIIFNVKFDRSIGIFFFACFSLYFGAYLIFVLFFEFFGLYVSDFI